jgi:hypothetical protein
MHDLRSMTMRSNAVGRGAYASAAGASATEEFWDEDVFSYKELLQQYKDNIKGGMLWKDTSKS